MPTYYFIYFSILLGISFLLVRYIILRKRSMAMLLFIKATKAENQENYQEAVNIYENALSEVKKTRFHRNLEIKIRAKLKLMQTIKIYKNDQAFVRKDNSWIH
jgi:hypothetical protein